MTTQLITLGPNQPISFDPSPYTLCSPNDYKYRIAVKPRVAGVAENAFSIVDSTTGSIMWTVGGTPGVTGSSVVTVQMTQGNLVATNKLTTGAPVFTTGLTPVSSSTNQFILNADGSGSLINQSGVQLWRTFKFSLTEGASLTPYMYVYSSDKKFKCMLVDGKMVITAVNADTTSGAVTWSTATWNLSGTTTVDPASTITSLTLTGGNLVGKNASGAVLLHTGLPAATNSYFKVEADGSASIYSVSNVKLWSSSSCLISGQKLMRGKSLRSVDGLFEIKFDVTGSLIAQQYATATDTSPSAVTWSQPIVGTSADSYAVVTPSGQLAVFASGSSTSPLWSTAVPTTKNVFATALVARNGERASLPAISTAQLMRGSVTVWSNGNNTVMTSASAALLPGTTAAISSPQNKFTCRLTSDGLFQVIVKSTQASSWSTALWNSFTNGNVSTTGAIDEASRIKSVQMSNGNLSGLNASNVVIFSAGLPAETAAGTNTFSITSDGFGVILNSEGIVIWRTDSMLYPGQKLWRGSSLWSCDQSVQFTFGAGPNGWGQLRTLTYGSNTTKIIWSGPPTASTATTDSSYLTILGNGDMVVYTSANNTNPKWWSVTDYGMPTRLAVANDAAGTPLVNLYFMSSDAKTTALWSDGVLQGHTGGNGTMRYSPDSPTPSSNTLGPIHDATSKMLVSSDYRYRAELTSDGRYRVVDTSFPAQSMFYTVSNGVYTFAPQAIKWTTTLLTNGVNDSARKILLIGNETADNYGYGYPAAIYGLNKDSRTVFAVYTYTYQPYMTITTAGVLTISRSDGVLFWNSVTGVNTKAGSPVLYNGNVADIIYTGGGGD